MSLHALSYVGFNAADLDDWRRYATEVPGMQAVDQTTDTLRLRMDEKHHRFALLGGPHDVFHHIMIEVNSLDDVGMGNELTLSQGHHIAGQAHQRRRLACGRVRRHQLPGSPRPIVRAGLGTGFGPDRRARQ